MRAASVACTTNPRRASQGIAGPLGTGGGSERDTAFTGRDRDVIDGRVTAAHQAVPADPGGLRLLHAWFAEPDFRGCAFINSFGELGATSEVVAAAAHTHKEAFHRYLAGLVTAAGEPARLADHLALLAEGAMTTAAISGSVEPARHARDAARILLDTGHAGARAAGSAG